MAEAGKKKAGREGPQSGAAYIEGDRKRQGDGFVGLKNRSSKINSLSMWFYDTTLFRAKWKAGYTKLLAQPVAAVKPDERPHLFVSSNGKENPSYTREPESGRAANRAWERLSEARKNLLGWQGELPTHRAYCLLCVYQRLYRQKGGEWEPNWRGPCFLKVLCGFRRRGIAVTCSHFNSMRNPEEN
ncbi:hypothetical protein J2857_003672 [Neorhizobium galegae]|uniref:hypothetical protein n=1 Tax=Neorhizobium galegae TaxID=399 RepID=UPI001AE92FE6|nr:hypothetical protein [Neorhizobium galegae]MBP2560903.1 hypothetical protein [Neorhizobium galegae]